MPSLVCGLLRKGFMTRLEAASTSVVDLEVRRMDYCLWLDASRKKPVSPG